MTKTTKTPPAATSTPTAKTTKTATRSKRPATPKTAKAPSPSPEPSAPPAPVESTVGLTLAGRLATDLQLSADRDVTRLALLSPNVFSAPGASPISANGQRSRNNNFTIDGNSS